MQAGRDPVGGPRGRDQRDETRLVTSRDEIEAFFGGAQQQYNDRGVTDTRPEIQGEDWIGDRAHCMIAEPAAARGMIARPAHRSPHDRARAHRPWQR